MDVTSCYECHNKKAAVLDSGLCHKCQKALLEFFEKSIDRIPAEARKERELFLNSKLGSKNRLRTEEK